MALAVCLLFDARGERRMRQLWDRLEQAGVHTLRSHTHGRHHPHLSYAVLLAWDRERVAEAVSALPDEGPITLGFHGTVLFPRGRAALVPSLPAAVVARQERVSRAVAATGATVHHHYEPGSWVPHVSVATGATGAQLPVVVTAIADVLPLTVVAERAVLIDSSTGETWPLPNIP
jgi:hypothetical protein